MPPHPRCLIALLGLICAAGPALARPALYVCGEGLEVKVDFTPRKAQLHIGDQQTTLQRIRSARDAHYVNRKAGTRLVARQGELTLHEGGRTLACKLQIAP
ncbi:MAG: MliC family protein [Burkholderiaceae bacterium]